MGLINGIYECEYGCLQRECGLHFCFYERLLYERACHSLRLIQ